MWNAMACAVMVLMALMIWPDSARSGRLTGVPSDVAGEGVAAVSLPLLIGLLSVSLRSGVLWRVWVRLSEGLLAAGCVRLRTLCTADRHGRMLGMPPISVIMRRLRQSFVACWSHRGLVVFRRSAL